jgi:hypothetical protein
MDDLRDLEGTPSIPQLAGNNLSYIAAVPGASQTLVLAGNQQPLRLAKDALRTSVASS